MENNIETKTLLPSLFPALCSIQGAIANDGVENSLEKQQMVLFENGTYVLLQENETIESVISEVGDFEISDLSTMVCIKMHYYKKHDIILFVHQTYPKVGHLEIVPKDFIHDSTEIRQRIVTTIREGLKNKKIIADGRKEDLSKYTVGMYFVVNSSLKMGKGKMCAQVGHAVETLVEDLLSNPTQNYIDWKNGLRRKIVLKATHEQINNFLKKSAKKDNSGPASDNKFITVQDAGVTQIEPGSMTVIGFAPMQKLAKSNFLSELKLL